MTGHWARSILVQATEIFADTRHRDGRLDREIELLIKYAEDSALEARCRRKEMVRMLLEKEANHGTQDNDGLTPLWSASQQGHAGVVEMLLNKGAMLSIDVASKDGKRRPIHQAAQNGHSEVVKLLLGHGAEPDVSPGDVTRTAPTPLMLASQSGSFPIVEMLLAKGKGAVKIDFQARPSLRSLLRQATQGGYTKIIEVLLDYGADVNAREEVQWTPLMMAAQLGNMECVNLFLRMNSIDIDAAEKDGATALWIASQQGHTQIVELLLQKGAIPMATSDSLRRPIHQAAQNGHYEVVKLLVDKRNDEKDAKHKRGMPPMTLAVQGEDKLEERTKIAQYLHLQGAQVVTFT